MENKTKKEKIREILKHFPLSSFNSFNKRTSKEIDKLYQEGIENGVIKEEGKNGK